MSKTIVYRHNLARRETAVFFYLDKPLADGEHRDIIFYGFHKNFAVNVDWSKETDKGYLHCGWFSEPEAEKKGKRKWV